MRIVTLILLVTFLVVYIRGEITIDLSTTSSNSNSNGINNLILIRIDGDSGRQCMQVSDLFPVDTIIVGSYFHHSNDHDRHRYNKTFYASSDNSRASSSSSSHDEMAVVIIHNLESNEICDQTKRQINVVSSSRIPSSQTTEIDLPSLAETALPAYSTTIFRFRVFEVFLECSSRRTTRYMLDRRKRSQSKTSKKNEVPASAISSSSTAANLFAVPPDYKDMIISNVVADAVVMRKRQQQQHVVKTRTSEYVEFTNIHDSVVHTIDMTPGPTSTLKENETLRIHVDGDKVTLSDYNDDVPGAEISKNMPTRTIDRRYLSTSDASTPSSSFYGIGTLELNTVDELSSVAPPVLVRGEEEEETTTSHYGIGPSSVVFNSDSPRIPIDKDQLQLKIDTLSLEDDEEESLFVSTKFDLFESDADADKSSSSEISHNAIGVGGTTPSATAVVGGTTNFQLPPAETIVEVPFDEISTTSSGSFLPPTRCAVPPNECCSDFDCSIDGEGCLGRRCVTTGNPRFTLTWYGDDDLDLYVETPDGTVLSFENTYDEVSGGIVGEDTDQLGLSFHAENVYFPSDRSPPGTYSYYVRPLRTTYRADIWTLSVGDGENEVARHTGTGFSTTYFHYKGAEPTISPPPATLPTPTGGGGGRPCLSPFDECCADTDCLFDGEICVHRTCIDDGSLRFTLTWIGDDDYDLYVETPSGTEISYRNLYDLESGGRFGEEVDQFGSGYHVENIFFPLSGAPIGEYHFYVRSLWSRGGSIDNWQVTVVENGAVKTTRSGAGVSTLFTYVNLGNPSPPSQPTSPVFPTPAPMLSPNLPTRPRPPAGSVAPAVAPSVPPPTEECSIFFDECCDVSDCRNSRDLCIQRTCVTEGNPRFTLVWDGDDDLDLFVVTPTGTEISTDFVFDGLSGGRFDRDIDQSDFGSHIENIYFPLLGTPSGEYSYGVRSSARRGIGDDRWSIEVYDDGELIAEHTGLGQSTTFTYIRDEEFEGPQRPRPAPPRCSSFTDECCIESDCVASDEICLQRTCINDGSLRFTLQWIGDDDIDLYVETPESTIIFFGNDYDSSSGGRFGEDSSQDSFGFHVENIYFPTAGAPTGAYTYFVLSSATRGVGADIWTVTIAENGEEVERQSGIGDSRDFTYFRLIDPITPRPTPPSAIATPAPVPTGGGCSLSNSECCFDGDCGNDDQICAQHHCVSRGNPRITLSYLGNDDVNLYVKTPGGATLSFERRNDPVSLGKFESGREAGFGNRVQSISFPTSGGPLGTYTILVRQAIKRGDADLWTVQIFENEVEVVKRIGTGDLPPFRYNRDQDSIPPPSRAPSPRLPTFPVPTGPLPVPTPQRPVVLPPPTTRTCLDECCIDDDCHVEGELCVQRTCIAEGSPRFTLSWTGNDDYSLAVITPSGNTVSFLNTFDEDSGGIFGEDHVQSLFGFHVENIFFPTSGGPAGTYTYFVRSVRPSGDDDRWTVRIYVGGRLAVWQTGTGDSRGFSYTFDGVVTTPAPIPTIAPPTFPTMPAAPSPVPPTGRCQIDSDCIAGQEVCVQRTCIDEGNPRFTLTFTGNDDLDLSVVTPLGVTISKTNTLDDVSGGVFGESSVQSLFGLHVENIYFPFTGGPTGSYSYYVTSRSPVGSDDIWQISVHVGGERVALQSGRGTSVVFNYDFLGGVFTPAPVPPPSFLPPGNDDCSLDSDCKPSETCVQRTCIHSGNPRVTLFWVGDDDYDLIVITPLGTRISLSKPNDPLSGGMFGEPGRQSGFGNHVENIYFPLSGGPTGTYSFFVRSFRTEGVEDPWSVAVVVNGNTIQLQSGIGTSSTFNFDFGQVIAPTPAPAEPDLCDARFEECCSDNDCIFGNEVCLQRSCVDMGNPMIALEWEGDDDLDLVVVTPLGTIVSYANEVDSESGGVFSEPGDQFGFSKHVESVFFPLAGGPIGTYTYFVRSFLPEGSHDVWTVNVFVNGARVASTSGFGSSAAFTYEFDGAVLPPSPLSVPSLPSPPSPTLSPPTSSPAVCNVNVDECCSDAQCVTGFELCVQRTCIDRGNPRFTLTWDSSSDYDIHVETPLGTAISFIEPLDELSGGIYGEDGTQFSARPHVESIYFPLTGAPLGIYTYFVRSFQRRDDNDSWTIKVFVGDEEVASQSGSGDSITFTYNYQGGGAIEPTSSPVSVSCTTMIDECCEDSDCNVGLEVCVQRRCINKGNPRITLTWLGDDDYDLAVVTPLGTTVAVSSVADEASGGVFGERGDQFEFGRHVENVFFPLTGGPSGTYTYFVSSFFTNGEPDTWTVTVHIDDIQVASHTGSGTSGLFVYDYVNGPAVTPIGCDIEVDECCEEGDCILFQSCVQRTCIDDGSPSFVLTWNGDDDLDLTVTPPVGNEISFQNQFDEESGGRFGEDAVQFFFGLHVENIYFPITGGPEGTYIFKVQSFNFVGELDFWTVHVFVDGEEVATESGKGASGELSFDFDQPGSPSPAVVVSPTSIFPAAIDTSQPSELCPIEGGGCCSDSDCPVEGDLCVQGICVKDGNPRISLSWEGSADSYDLQVATPLGTVVSFTNPIDPRSNGIYGEPGVPLWDGTRVKNVYFPTPGGPGGTYTFEVIAGDGAETSTPNDMWTVEVFIDGQLTMSEIGSGESSPFTFNYVRSTDGQSTLEAIRLGQDVCSTNTDECCEDSDCQGGSLKICVQRMCIRDGELRFTLESTAGAAYSLTVSTPGFETLSSTHTYGIASEGKWETRSYAGAMVRNVVFPGGVTRGRYTYAIGGSERAHTEWTMRIYANGVEARTYTGRGVSSMSFFEFD